ncbi:hypothetical protein [Pseudomonas sp. PLMAX]|uniref:hypothetical protein n=1 Tax=Pseudomonas sp. PLMAX TaxID=2201998 RepID=UPI0038B725B1
MAIPLIFSGVSYHSLTQLHWTIRPDVTYQAFRLSYLRHTNPDGTVRENEFIIDLEVIAKKVVENKEKHKKFNEKPIEYLGKTYKNLKELFLSIDGRSVSYKAFINRVEQSIGYYEAATKAPDISVIHLIAGGVKYDSLAGLAKANDIPYMLAYSRLRAGYTGDEIVSGRVIVKKEKKVTVGNVLYESISAAHKILCPDEKIITVKSRLAKGWSPEEAFGIHQRVNQRGAKANTYEYDGGQYTAKSLALMLKVNYQQLSKLLVSGQTVKEAMKNFTGMRRCVVKPPAVQGPFYVDGLKFDKISEISSHYGVDYTLLYNRINAPGWTIKEAIEGRRNYEYKGEAFSCLKDIWKKYGRVSHSVFSNRYHQGGQDLDVCLGIVEHPMAHLDGEYIVDGRSFRTIDEVCSYLKISKSMMSTKLRKMSLKEAVEEIKVSAESRGRYCKKYFDKHPAMKDVSSNFYLMSFESEGSILHKVGVTRGDIAMRFRGKSDCNLIKSANGKLYDMYMLVQALLERFSSLKHKAGRFVQGRTETFKLTSDDLQIVVEYIDTFLPEVVVNPSGI